MKYISLATTTIVLLTRCCFAEAAESFPIFEAKTGLQVGVTQFRNADTWAGSAPFGSVFISERLSLPRWSSFSLELNSTIPSGFGANLIIDVVHLQDLRIHIFDPGLHLNVWKKMSSDNIPRDFDVTFGAGTELRLKGNWWLVSDWRVFLPDPITVATSYGNLARRAVSNALEGGQVWLGVSYAL